MNLDIMAIKKALPHRFPFLLVDRVVEMIPGERIVAIKNVTINEEFFNGHFPDFPVMPGVLIIEAMAQAGGILALSGETGSVPKTVFFMSIDGAKFRRPVVPGDQLRLEVSIVKRRNTIWRMRGEAYVGDQLVSEADLQAMLADRP